MYLQEPPRGDGASCSVHFLMSSHSENRFSLTVPAVQTAAVNHYCRPGGTLLVYHAAFSYFPVAKSTTVTAWPVPVYHASCNIYDMLRFEAAIWCTEQECNGFEFGKKLPGQKPRSPMPWKTLEKSELEPCGTESPSRSEALRFIDSAKSSSTCLSSTCLW